jgi:hypothetical protein
MEDTTTAATLRARVSAVKDGEEGWITLKDRYGDELALRTDLVQVHFRTGVTSSHRDARGPLLTWMEPNEFFREDGAAFCCTEDNSVRVRGRVSSSGIIGWITRRGDESVVVRYTLVTAAPLTTGTNPASPTAGRVLAAGESVDLIERVTWIDAEPGKEPAKKKKKRKKKSSPTSGWLEHSELAESLERSRARREKAAKKHAARKAAKAAVSGRLSELRAQLLHRLKPIKRHPVRLLPRKRRTRRHVVIQKRYRDGVLVATKRTSTAAIPHFSSEIAARALGRWPDR